MKRPTTRESLITNLNRLMKLNKLSNRQVGLKAGISPKQVGNILNGESNPTVDTTDKLAAAFGLTGWALISPNLNYDIARTSQLETLIDNYSRSSGKGRSAIDLMAEMAATHNSNG